MRGFLKSFLLTCILCNITTAWAVGFSEPCNETNTCDNNLYCDSDTDTCASCSRATGGNATTIGAYPYSVEGATSKGDCYATCTTQGVTLGQFKTEPENKIIYQKDNTTCNYTLQCVDDAVPNDPDPNKATACGCANHYHKIGEGEEASCTPICYKIELDKNLDGDNNPDTNTDTLYLSVKYNTGFYNNQTCSDAPLTYDSRNWGTKPNSEWWQKFIRYNTKSLYQLLDENGKPIAQRQNLILASKVFIEKIEDEGDGFTSDHTATLYGYWETNDYTIEYYDDETKLFSNQPDQTCPVKTHNATTPEPDSDHSCSARNRPFAAAGQTITGWSLTKDSTTINYHFGHNIKPNKDTDTVTLYAVWGNCPQGYYCNTSGQHACPAGTTSPSGSDAQTDCYISNATQFGDELGTFTLPIDTINYQ